MALSTYYIPQTRVLESGRISLRNFGKLSPALFRSKASSTLWDKNAFSKHSVISASHETYATGNRRENICHGISALDKQNTKHMLPYYLRPGCCPALLINFLARFPETSRTFVRAHMAGQMWPAMCGPWPSISGQPNQPSQPFSCSSSERVCSLTIALSSAATGTLIATFALGNIFRVIRGLLPCPAFRVGMP